MTCLMIHLPTHLLSVVFGRMATARRLFYFINIPPGEERLWWRRQGSLGGGDAPYLLPNSLKPLLLVTAQRTGPLGRSARWSARLGSRGRRETPSTGRRPGGAETSGAESRGWSEPDASPLMGLGSLIRFGQNSLPLSRQINVWLRPAEFALSLSNYVPFVSGRGWN